MAHPVAHSSIASTPRHFIVRLVVRAARLAASGREVRVRAALLSVFSPLYLLRVERNHQRTANTQKRRFFPALGVGALQETPNGEETRPGARGVI
jgi:hypothetical protein